MTNNERKNITLLLSKGLEKYINPKSDTRIYWAKEVTFDYGKRNSTKRVDYMKFKPLNNYVSGIEKGDFYCYEIKSCIQDFNSKNGHNFIGDYNYYVMRQSDFNLLKNSIPYGIGVLALDDTENLKSVKKARRNNRKISALEMLLMMYRSWQREATKDDLFGEETK
nr:MAG TPA: DNA repair protein MmcB-like protein [Caudoviricetes sp.]